MRWSEIEESQPRLASLGRTKLEAPGVVLLATIRRDGSPRISPVEPLFWEGDLWMSMLWRSRKAADVSRDPRVLLHSIVTSRDGAGGEYKVRGRVVGEEADAVRTAYARAVSARLGWDPEPGRFHLYRVDVKEITVIRYDDATGDQFVARWPAGVEFVRRGKSATRVGPPQPHSELLV